MEVTGEREWRRARWHWDGAQGRWEEGAAETTVEMRGASTEQAMGLVGQQQQLQQSLLLSSSSKQRWNKCTSTDGREQEVQMTSEGFTGAGSKFLLQEAVKRKNDPILGAPARVFHLFPLASVSVSACLWILAFWKECLITANAWPPLAAPSDDKHTGAQVQRVTNPLNVMARWALEHNRTGLWTENATRQLRWAAERGGAGFSRGDVCVSAPVCGVGGQVYPRERTVLIQFDVKPSGLKSL